MRFWLRTVLLCAGTLCAAFAGATMPATVSITVHGDFDPGSSGGTADNSSTLSSLSIRDATVVFDASVISEVVSPGDTVDISLGTLTTSAGSLTAIAFDGATLNLTVEVSDPPAAPTLAVIPLDIKGSVGVSGETLTFSANAGQDQADFLTTFCVPKVLSVKVVSSATVTSGDPPTDIAGTLSVSYADPFEAGDVDGDGSVTLMDAVRGLQIVSGIDEGQCDEVERGDMAGSGVLDLVNVVSIARKAFGIV